MTRFAVLFICTIVLLTVTSVGDLQARPPQNILPKPYILNRGDGDTINGKYFMFENSGEEGSIYPPGPATVSGTDARRTQKYVEKRIQAIKWIILYRLIR